MHRSLLFATFFCASLFDTVASAAPREKLEILFLGDRGHHQPYERAAQIIPVLELRGIDVTYTDRLNDLNEKTLSAYDGLMIYANWAQISKSQERAVLDFVASGKGFIPIHCASYCFLNSPSYIELLGAQFSSHGTGVFRTEIQHADHPVIKGFEGFETWDETYVHTKQNPDCVVLQVRDERGRKEPWTWVRKHGKGRVFYSAYGHDHRTFGHPAFHDLLERGIRWACGEDGVTPSQFVTKKGLPPFEFDEANIPFYSPKPGGGPRGADGWNQMQRPLDPKISQRHLVVPRGFRAELFASEPDIKKPICMAWDERGRLWIAETVDYPNELKPEREGNDVIKILEDTDHDGRADKFTVFADKLSIPTSLTFSRGGVIVQQAPDTLFLKDTSGDGRADVRKVLLSGWGTGDTHAGPSNLRWGFDNWIWGMLGYSGFNGTVGQEHHRFPMGFYRFRPDGSKLEYIRTTNNNTWGIGFSEEGIVFGSTANNNPSVYMPIANRYYERVRGWSASRLGTIAASSVFYPITEKVRQVDAHGRFTAGAGHALYTARSYPKTYWNRTSFVAGPTGHLVGTFTLEGRGSDFVSRNSWNLVASDDEWTAPIMAEVGPDGSVWVIDWYNYIVQHNPTPHGFKTGRRGAYVTPLRDKVHGRIYRIVHENSPRYVSIDLSLASTEQLVATLQNDNLLWRMHAQRLLVESQKMDAIPQLIALVNDRSVDSIGLNTAAIHALCSLRGLEAISDEHPGTVKACFGALTHPSAGVRRMATICAPRDNPSTAAVLVSAGVHEDEDAQVRLATFLAFSELPASEAVGAAITRSLWHANNMTDRWMRDAITSAAAAHDAEFLQSLAIVDLDTKAYPEISGIIERVARHYALGAPETSVTRVIQSLTELEPEIASAIVAGLSDWPADKKPDVDDRLHAALIALLHRLPTGRQGSLVKLATEWGDLGFENMVQEIAASLHERIEDTSIGDAERAEAAREIIKLRSLDTGAIDGILGAIDPRMSPELARSLIAAVGGSDSPATGKRLLSKMSALSPTAKKAALEVLLLRADWTESLLDAIETGAVQILDLSLPQRQQLSSHPNRKLASRTKAILARGGRLPSPDREAVIQKLLPLCKKTGDALRGASIFKEHCSKCHRHGSEGSDIGPDLTGMNAHPKEELLINILDPNRSVEGNFQVYSVVTTRGRVLSGLLASESRTSVEIIDTEGKTQAVQRVDIAEFVASKTSLMPEGFEKQVDEQGLADLLTFLTRRGKFLTLPLDKAATIVSSRGMFHSKDAGVERLIFPDWSPKIFRGVPFRLVDPQGGRTPNVIMLRGSHGKFPPRMPKSVRVPCNTAAKAIHLLSGVSGWGAQSALSNPTLTMIVRLHYEDGSEEDHNLLNGVHFADYIGVFNVPGSELAFKLRGQQVRYLAVYPQRDLRIREVEFVKGNDSSAPIVMAATVESTD